MEEVYLDEVYDEEGRVLSEYDLSIGQLVKQRRSVIHDAVEGAEEQGHWEVVAEYSGGGKDVAWVVDVPGVEARDAWEEIQIYNMYVPYTQQELDEMERLREQPSAEEEIAALRAALDALLGGITDA